MFRIAIVDDDKAALSIVSSAVNSFFQEKNIDYNIMSFSNPLNYLATIKEEDFNLVFLDIDMPEQDGLSVAEETLIINKNTHIIFLSQREDLVFKCLAIHPFGFIRKSNLINDFSLMMNQFYDYYLSNNDEGKKIEFVEKNRTISFKINEIMYISSDKNYQDIVTKDNKIETVRIPLSTLENKLKNDGFIRVHKCYIVNQIYIRSILNEEIKLTNDITIPLSKKRRDEVLKEYLTYSRNNNSMII
mgnify:FL=1